jgi:hypothetical protein
VNGARIAYPSRLALVARLAGSGRYAGDRPMTEASAHGSRAGGAGRTALVFLSHVDD